MEKVALVVGASGITGSNVARKLLSTGWPTFGLARTPQNNIGGLIPLLRIFCIGTVWKARWSYFPHDVFITSWMRNATEAENIRVNSLMVRNLLDVLSPKQSVQHVALVTGLKHYLGPFEDYAREGFLPETPVREEHPPENRKLLLRPGG